MRKKLKEIMDKEEGFTLVELLAVIVILGIILAIAVPAIGNVISDSQSKAQIAEIELIEDAARLYDTAEEKPVFPVTVEKLTSEGYLDLRKSKTSGSVSKDGKDFKFAPATASGS